MDQLKRRRRPLRSAVTRVVKDIENELAKGEPNILELQVKLDALELTETGIAELDQQVVDALINTDCTDEDLQAEEAAASEYRENIFRVKRKVNSALKPARSPSPTSSATFSTAFGHESKKRTYKLPKIEIKKFSGNLIDWLGFWSQFEKIHEDEELHASDKFQYLVQSMITGTRARELVDSYPQTAENYPKVIEALKERFGKKKMLMQVYVRELLKMVIHNNGTREKITVCKMYDRLESHIRALDSLGVTTEQMAIFLYPMVESSLPEDTLIAWQRSPLNGKDGANDVPPKSELDYLMQFLRQEVENEDQRALAQAGFSVNSSKEKKKHQGNESQTKSSSRNEVATAAGLFSGEKTRCIFCEGGHESKDCIKAQGMGFEEKRNKVKAKNCCFICLRPGHQSKSCKAFVKCLLCGKKHQGVMCHELPAHKKEKANSVPAINQVQTSNSNLACSAKVILKTLMINVVGRRCERSVRALIDDGSQRSYILKRVAGELELSACGEEQLVHALFSGVQTSVKHHSKYDVKIKNMNGSGFTHVAALDQEKICGNIPRLTRGPWMNVLKKHKIWISDLGSDHEVPEVEVLLGADVIGKLLTGKVIQLPNGLTAVETILGWTLMGETKVQDDCSVAMSVTNMSVSDVSLEQLWNLDTIGINDPSESKSKVQKDHDTKQHFLETVTRGQDGRYSVSLPWMDGAQKIPDNKFVAEKRLASASKKLQFLGKFKDYDAIFRDWENEGIIEVVNTPEYEKPSYYLPHRAVFKAESSTTPIRPVFDASCKTGRSPSLNECLEKGPNLLELIPSILLHFREKKIGVVSDIRKAFQMIEMNEQDRDFLRFLWWEDSSQENLKVYRHRRVVFGVNCSPFLLGAVIEFHLAQTEKDKDVAEKLGKSLYVDNCVLSLDTVEECINFKEKSTAIMSQAQMVLRQWECGSHEVPGVGQLSSSWCGLGSDSTIRQLGSTSVLGLTWNKDWDNLQCDFESDLLPEKITKRTILSLTQKIFDPIGFTSPTTIVPKLILQSLWKEKCGWDEEVPVEFGKMFHQWYEKLNHLKEVQIPRNMNAGVTDRQTWQIHTFCDASQQAYAAAIYLRTETEVGVSVQLLQAKSRVAPIKKTSIPRLELIGCTIAARLATFVSNSLSLVGVPTFFWSDSTTALAWIRRNDGWGTFVGNRVKEICQLTAVENWRHVPGVLNPADLPSRGCNSQQLAESKWWEGPDWLKLSSREWPTETAEADEEAVSAERKKSVSLTMIANQGEEFWFAPSSSFQKNVIILAWMRRFIGKAQRESKLKGDLTVEETTSAELYLLKMIQTEALPSGESVVGGVRVVTDESGLMRVKTKLVYREDSVGFRYPVLLPHSHTLVDQIIREEHVRHKHAGVQFLMGSLREKFWIIQGRRAIRGVLNKCVVCRRFSAKSPDVVPAPLPMDRVKDANAFQVTGVDLAGPLFLKDQTKAWVVLFTCAIYRAVHFELVTSLSAEGFLLSLRRFIARRGRPSTIYSDNGTNFTGSHNALKELDWKKVLADSEAKRIQWKFNPPAAPWWGGFWERLVRSLKDLLKRNLGRSSLDYEELTTCLCDTEAVVNGRPLTCVTEDPEDLIPLTPAMFLQDIANVAIPDLDQLDSTGFQRRFRYRQKLREDLRSRFRKEYLSLLVQKGKEPKRGDLSIGDVVLVGSEQKRINWPMARVIELLPGKDGNIRVAKVKTALGVLLRPIQRLFPLEVSSEAETIPVNPEVKAIAVSEAEKSKLEDQVTKPEVRTRSGRRVVPPRKFGHTSE